VVSRSIRVAMIGQKGYPPIHGGIEKHVAELALRLGAAGFAIDIYSRPHYSHLNGPTEQPGITVRRLPSIPTKHLDAFSHSVLATCDVLLRPVDIVHYHALGPGLLAGLPRCLAHKATVVTVHGLDWQREKWGRAASAVLRLGEFGSVRLPHRTVVVSRALQEHFRRKHGRETAYIPNGITPPVYREPGLIRERGIAGRYLLFVGRLVPEKGCHLLVEAYAALPAAVRSRFALVIAGGAGFTNSYVQRLQEKASPGVHFLGYVHGPILEELYTNADLVVLPSTLEGLSITLLEGMSYGRCCLASDIPPNLEAAGGCAPLFRSGDGVDLCRCLEDLLASPERREDFGRRAQLHAIENYSWEHVVDQTAALYRGILAERSGRAAARN
jgi:glycosyltransferase involved in cell wall biosynthesis